MKSTIKKYILIGVAILSLTALSPFVLKAFAEGEAEGGESYQFGQGAAGINAALDRNFIERHIAATTMDTIESVIVGSFSVATGDPELVRDSEGKWEIRTYYDDPEYIAQFGEHRPALDVVADNIDFFYNDPMHYDTVEHLAQDWSPRAAQAANGQDTLLSIQTVWAFMRNLSYALLATVLVIIGIMIMFRQKIGGQMLVTIQNSIPRVLIVILLITISLPLVGVMIDISDILMGYINQLFESNSIALQDGDINNPFGLAWLMFVNFLFGTVPKFTAAAPVLTLIPPLSAFGLVSIVIAFLLFIMFLILSFKIWFMLISQFARLLLETVLLPLNILIGAIPGNEANIANSFKKIAVLIAAFPVSLFLLKLAFSMVINAGDVALPVNYGFINSSDGELFGSDVFGIIRLNGIIMYGILILIPNIPSILNETFKVEQSRAIQSAIENSAKDRAKVPIIGGLIGGR